MTTKISIVIPCYNSVRFIEQTIRSILDQGYPDFQCIVIDGGSNDGTLDILRKYEGRIKWLSEKDEGQSDAINKGLNMAEGDIVTYICADDFYEKDTFRKVSDFFASNPGRKWVYGKCRIVDEKDTEIRKLITWYKSLWQRRYSYTKLLVMDFLAQPAVFWRRELIEEIGLLDVKAQLAMEYDYWLRIGARYEPGFMDDYLANFRLHPVSKSSTRFSEAAREALDIAKKYATSERRGFLIPLQYLNYFLVVAVYSFLRICSL
ncbi:MAG: glycosyltransferase family 2 protein [Chloroflexota bacterium]